MSRMIKPVYKYEKMYVVIFWILYTGLSFFHLRERCMYADNSYYLFNIIQHKSLNLEHYRLSGVFSQWLIVIAVKLQLSFKLLLICFTVNPVLYHFMLFLLVIQISHNRLYVYMFLVMLAGAAYYSYFYTADEMSQNMPVLMVLTAIVSSEKITAVQKNILLFLCLTVLLFTHPLVIAVAGMLMFVLFIRERNATAVFALFSVMGLLLIKFLLLTTGRDQHLLSEISYKGITLRNIHSSAFASYFRSQALDRHLFTFATWFFLFFKGKTTPIARWSVIGSIVVLYLLIMLFLLHNTNEVYIDRYLYLLIVYAFAALLLVFKFDNSTPILNRMLVITVVFSFYRLFSMDYLDTRNKLLDKLLYNPEIKQIYRYEVVPGYLKQMSWSVPYETLLVSTLRHNTKTVLIKEAFYKIDSLLSDSTLFLGAEWTFGKANTLDTNYFKLPPARYVYRDL